MNSVLKALVTKFNAKIKSTLCRKIIPLSLFLASLPSPGLKHVSDNEKTHKNPTLRSQSPAVRAGPKPFASSAARPAAAATPTRTLPPVLELDGKKWKVVSCWFIHLKVTCK